MGSIALPFKLGKKSPDATAAAVDATAAAKAAAKAAASADKPPSSDPVVAATPAAEEVVEEEWPYGPLQPPEGLPWSEEYLKAQETLQGVPARAAQRRGGRRMQHPSASIGRPSITLPDPREWAFTTDSELRQMMESNPVTPFGGGYAETIIPRETKERLEAEIALKKVPPVEGAIELSGVGPGTEEQRLVKAVEAGFRVQAPGPTTATKEGEARLKSFSEPTWSPFHQMPQTRTEGTSWFIAPEPGTEGFDVVKVREKLLVPAEADISGKMHFGRTEGVESEGVVFSEGDISLPRLAAYNDALVEERANTYARYDALPNRAPLTKWASTAQRQQEAPMAKELQRLDADIKRVDRLILVLERLAEVAGINAVEIASAKAGAPMSIARVE